MFIKINIIFDEPIRNDENTQLYYNYNISYISQNKLVGYV